MCSSRIVSIKDNGFYGNTNGLLNLDCCIMLPLGCALISSLSIQNCILMKSCGQWIVCVSIESLVLMFSCF
ncbi:hypothetical protein RchiOBHm_Chr0c44g0503651 [Rosa chinensis]|uniref:Uncharacterized protein n=1 Tax=Rosa chinensis TaxID=74649 RepID=A0A2P6SQ26_ROSCH|nr:hypothetical protein RchiOBHm_Chr0c44g0503651 [Rosa chinensis]